MFTSKSKYSLSCDLSDHSIKIVQIVRRGKKYKLISYAHEKLSDGLILGGEIKKFDELVKVIKRQLSKLHGKKLLTRSISVNIPDAKSFIKLIKIPPPTEEEILSLIQKELGKHLPMNLEDVYFDYNIISKSDKNVVCLVAAVEKAISEQYYNLFKECDLDVHALELESVALTRAFTHDDLSQPLLILDFGHSRSTLTIIDQKSIQLSLSIPLTSDHINQTIAEKLKISVAQAEKAKRKCGLVKDKCKGALPIVLNSAMDDLAFKIDDAVKFYTSHNSHASTFNKIIITGGGANFLNIEQVLKEKTHREIVQGTSLISLDAGSLQKDMESHKDSLQYLMLAYGLALRGGT